MTGFMAAEHLCHARHCETPVPPRILFCDWHWRMVPEEVRHRIYTAYRPGQERDKRPSMAYLEAAFAAIDHVCGVEGHSARVRGGAR